MSRALLLALTGCHWAGWHYYDPGTQTGSQVDASLVSGLGGGALCAEWAYERDQASTMSDAKPAPEPVPTPDAGGHP